MNTVCGFRHEVQRSCLMGFDVEAELLQENQGWCFETEALSGGEVVHEVDVLELAIAELVDVKSSGQTSVDVLDGPLLPGGLSVAKVGGQLEGLAQQAVPGEGAWHDRA